MKTKTHINFEIRPDVHSMSGSALVSAAAMPCSDTKLQGNETEQQGSWQKVPTPQAAATTKVLES